MNELILQHKNCSLKDILKDIKCNLMQNIISCSSSPRLEYLSAVSIVISLWQQSDIRNLFGDVYRSRKLLHELYLREFIRKASEKLNHLDLPSGNKDDLRRVIESVGKEIVSFLSNSNLEFHTREEVNDVLNNIRFTQQGTINRLKTLTGILDNTDYTLVQKFKIACDSCLKDKVRDLYIKLPKYLRSHLTRDRNELVIYWTNYMRDQYDEYPSYLATLSYSYLLNWAITNNKEAAVQYIWENLSDAETKEDIVRFTRLVLQKDSFSMMIYFCLQLTHTQLEELLSTMGQNILKALFHSSRFHNAFVPAAKYILTSINKRNVDDALILLTYCWHKKALTPEDYKNIWIDFSKHFELSIDTNFKIVYKNLLHFHDLYLTDDLETFELFLSMGSYQVKKELLYENRSMSMCLGLIKSGNIDLLDIFLKKMLKSEGEIKKFNITLFETRGTEVCSNLIASNKYDVLNIFLNKFCGRKHIDRYKFELPYKDQAMVISHILMGSYVGGNLVATLNKFLIWCFEKNTQEIRRCKAVIFDPENNLYRDAKDKFYKNIAVVIEMNKWEYVKEYIKLVMSAIEGRINSRESTFSIIKLLYANAVNFVTQKEHIYVFKKFLTCIFKRNEAEELHNDLVDSEELFLTIRDLILLQKFKGANGILDWCYSSNADRMYQFRQRLMRTKNFILVSDIAKYDLGMEEAEAIFKWANPILPKRF